MRYCKRCYLSFVQQYILPNNICSFFQDCCMLTIVCCILLPNWAISQLGAIGCDIGGKKGRSTSTWVWGQRQNDREPGTFFSFKILAEMKKNRHLAYQTLCFGAVAHFSIGDIWMHFSDMKMQLDVAWTLWSWCCIIGTSRRSLFLEWTNRKAAVIAV